MQDAQIVSNLAKRAILDKSCAAPLLAEFDAEGSSTNHP